MENFFVSKTEMSFCDVIFICCSGSYHFTSSGVVNADNFLKMTAFPLWCVKLTSELR